MCNSTKHCVGARSAIFNGSSCLGGNCSWVCPLDASPFLNATQLIPVLATDEHCSKLFFCCIGQLVQLVTQEGAQRQGNANALLHMAAMSQIGLQIHTLLPLYITAESILLRHPSSCAKNLQSNSLMFSFKCFSF